MMPPSLRLARPRIEQEILIVRTAREMRAEAVYRVDRRYGHSAELAVDPAAHRREYDREELHVRSLARQFPWDQVVSKPSPAYLAKGGVMAAGGSDIQARWDRLEKHKRKVAKRGIAAFRRGDNSAAGECVTEHREIERYMARALAELDRCLGRFCNEGPAS
jgi:hypothetical protein